jgi:hypothetical protein
VDEAAYLSYIYNNSYTITSIMKSKHLEPLNFTVLRFCTTFYLLCTCFSSSVNKVGDWGLAPGGDIGNFYLHHNVQDVSGPILQSRWEMV